MFYSIFIYIKKLIKRTTKAYSNESNTDFVYSATIINPSIIKISKTKPEIVIKAILSANNNSSFMFNDI